MDIPANSLGDYVLFNEDCLTTSKRLPDFSVDLIYADPPFFTGRFHSMNGCSFDDRWTNALEYSNWLKPRLEEFKRILKPTGSLYIHCDWHISHYIKVLADEIFGINNFLNEIIWKRQSAHNDSKQGSRHLGRIHDTILVYTGSQKYTWNQQFLPYDLKYLERTYKYLEANSERRYAVGDLTGPGGAEKGNPQYDFLGVKRYWRYSEAKMKALFADGRIAFSVGKVPLLKRYLDEMRGKSLQDMWTDISIGKCKNRYPTQKPEALLERIIKCSSNLNQVIYEPFAGSATAGVVCCKLGRKWIGSEISDTACNYVTNRFKEICIKLMFFSATQLESCSFELNSTGGLENLNY